MVDDNVSGWESRVASESRSALEEALREGARRMLMAALEAEVADYIERERKVRGEDGRRMVVRNGRLPGRNIQTGLGPIPINQPRVHDRRAGQHFTSAILPRYLRRAPSIEALIPWLYLKGVSTNDFPEALKAILGEGAAGLSPSTIVRLKSAWEQEYRDWVGRDLAGRRYIYVWADGVYFNVRLSGDRPCLLVVVGTLPDGRKELMGDP